MDNSKKNKIYNVIRYAVMVVAICVFCYSAYELISIYGEYRQGEDEYSSLSHVIFETKENQTYDTVESVDSDTTNETEEKEEFVFDYASLYNINQDAVGWILIDGTSISYPMVQGSDNSYYLSHTINGTENGAGTIFLDARMERGFVSDNVIIYGHNMKNGTMFGELKKYNDENFYKKHNIINIFTEYEICEYEVFAVAIVEPTDTMVYAYDLSDEEHFEQYRNYINSIKLYDTNVNIYSDDKLITLSTCTSDSEQRLVVVAKKIN